jgi:hypothetical protein
MVSRAMTTFPPPPKKNQNFVILWILIKLTGNHKKGLVSLLKQTAVFDLIMA